MSNLTTALWLSFLSMGIWLSLRSWTRSLRRDLEETRSQALLRDQETRELVLRAVELLQRQQEQRFLQAEAKLEQNLVHLQDQHRALLLEALTPVAQAMLRQDKRHQERGNQLEELLLEVLSSLQPSAQEQISKLIGQQLPSPTSPSLAS